AIPAGHENQRAGNRRPGERREVGGDVKKGTANVQAVAARADEQRSRRDVDGNPGKRECEHQPAVNVGRRDEPPYRLEDDPDPDEGKRDPVRERGENLHAPETERPTPAWGP